MDHPGPGWPAEAAATAEIQAACRRYLETYFVARDLPATLALFAPDITGYGTGGDEIAYTAAELARLYARDLAEAPNPIHYALRRLIVTQPAPQTAIAAAEVDIHTRILDQALKINGLRLSLVWARPAGDWRLAHMHISLPTGAHAADEAFPVKELEERNQVLQRLVEEKTDKLNAALREISVLASTDKLTGLANRLRIEDLLDGELDRSRRYANVFAVIMLDIDHFKAINDAHGHLRGDQILAEFAGLLRRRLRRTDQAGRWGGEEFIVICAETGAAEAAGLAEALRAAVAGQAFEALGPLSASFGVTAFQAGDTRDSLLGRVDAALYAAKHAGRNQVQVR